MEFVTLTNDVAELSGVVNLTSADVTLDTDGRDRFFKLVKIGTVYCLALSRDRFQNPGLYREIRDGWQP